MFVGPFGTQIIVLAGASIGDAQHAVADDKLMLPTFFSVFAWLAEPAPPSPAGRIIAHIHYEKGPIHGYQ